MTVETWKIFEYLLPKLAALLSLFGSSMIVAEVYQDWKIKRYSRQGLNAVSRALLQMSIGDIFFSFAWFIASWVVSQSPGGSTSFEASQTSGACKFQGFLVQFGFFASISFNASLAVIYLLMVRYSWTNSQITRRFRQVAIMIWIVALVLAIVPLALNLYHDIGENCWLSGAPPSSDLPQCQNEASFYEHPECTERTDITNLLMGMQILPVWICIILNARIMYVIYRETKNMEQKITTTTNTTINNNETTGARTGAPPPLSSIGCALQEIEQQQQQATPEPDEKVEEANPQDDDGGEDNDNNNNVTIDQGEDQPMKPTRSRNSWKGNQPGNEKDNDDVEPPPPEDYDLNDLGRRPIIVLPAIEPATGMTKFKVPSWRRFPDDEEDRSALEPPPLDDFGRPIISIEQQKQQQKQPQSTTTKNYTKTNSETALKVTTPPSWRRQPDEKDVAESPAMMLLDDLGWPINEEPTISKTISEPAVIKSRPSWRRQPDDEDVVGPAPGMLLDDLGRPIIEQQSGAPSPAPAASSPAPAAPLPAKKAAEKPKQQKEGGAGGGGLFGFLFGEPEEEEEMPTAKSFFGWRSSAQEEVSTAEQQQHDIQLLPTVRQQQQQPEEITPGQLEEGSSNDSHEEQDEEASAPTLSGRSSNLMDRSTMSQSAMSHQSGSGSRRSRTVGVQGLWYIGGFFVTYLPGTISVLVFVISGSWNTPLYRASLTFLALQGAWNFVVFCKGRREMKTWIGANVKTFIFDKLCFCCQCIPKAMVPPSPGVSMVTPRTSRVSTKNKDKDNSGADATTLKVNSGLLPSKGSGYSELSVRSARSARSARSGSGHHNNNMMIRSDVSTEVHENRRSLNFTSVFSNASTVVHANLGGDSGLPTTSSILVSVAEDTNTNDNNNGNGDPILIPPSPSPSSQEGVLTNNNKLVEETAPRSTDEFKIPDDLFERARTGETIPARCDSDASVCGGEDSSDDDDDSSTNDDDDGAEEEDLVV